MSNYQLIYSFILCLVLNFHEFIEAGHDSQPTARSNVSHPCPQPKVGKCSCEWKGPYCKVFCSGLDALPKNLTTMLTGIYISDGNINEVPKHYFTRFKKLQALSLRNNKVSNKFLLPKSVWHVNLGGNMLKPSHLHGMFDGLKKVTDIDLSYNQLQDNLIPGTFRELERLSTLTIQSSDINDIKKGTFVGLDRLYQLSLSYNKIRILRKGTFKGIKNTRKYPIKLIIKSCNLAHIEDGTLKDFMKITALSLYCNNLTKFPDLEGMSENIEDLDFTQNSIPDFNTLNKYGIKSIGELLLGRNRISVITSDIFKGINVRRFLDLSGNRINHIPAQFLDNCTDLLELMLNDNEIKTIDKDSFKGLSLNLNGLYLFNNKLTQLPDGVFKDLSLSNLFLNGNDFKNLTGRPFKGMKKAKTTLYLFSNKIASINQSFLNDLDSQASLFVTCTNLVYLPRFQLPSTAEIVCAPHGLKAIKGLNHMVARALYRSGFSCEKKYTNDWDCEICGVGSFGNGTEHDPGCTKCSSGGFYQDEMGKIHCKKCNIGTYVHPIHAPGTTPLSCQACPQGTNSSEYAGYRGCKCLKDFYRFNRFGKCSPCPSKAFTCEMDYLNLSPGYYWKWENKTLQKMYTDFTNNLRIESREFSEGAWEYNGTRPKPYKCPRDSCLGGLDSKCRDGYQGPLCAVCDKTLYYERMNRCIRCPSSLQAGLQIAGVVVLFVIVLLALLWGDNKRTKAGRTMADVILSCFKIMVGFYQVMAGLYSSFSKVQWPPSVIWIQKTLHFIQLNILQFAPLSCVSSKLSFNALQQFVLVSTTNFVVVFLVLFYLVIRIKQLKRKESLTASEIAERVAHTKISCIRNICVFLFATYPRTCTSIFQILSLNCVALCTDNEETRCESYLKSDFSVRCDAHFYTVYSRISFAFLVYPIGFPLAILFLVWKYVYKPSKNQSTHLELPEILQDDETSVPASKSAIVYSSNTNQTKTPFKSGLSLFYENYKPNCWYWETVEMIRKLVLISGLTLIGEQSRTQIGLGAIISALFAILYVYLRPIANKFENLLQTVALMAIFLNLGIGVMLRISDNELSPSVNRRVDKVGVGVLLILINVAVIVIVIVACFKIIAMRIWRCCKSADHTCHGDECCKACGMFCLSLLITARIDSGDLAHTDMRTALLEDSKEA